MNHDQDPAWIRSYQRFLSALRDPLGDLKRHSSYLLRLRIRYALDGDRIKLARSSCDVGYEDIRMNYDPWRWADGVTGDNSEQA